MLGRRRVFLAALAIFSISSLLGGLAGQFTRSLPLLLAARARQGVGAALLAPATIAMIAVLFAEGRERNSAMGIYGAVSAGGGAFGVLFGGLLTAAAGWPSVLYVNVPVALIVGAIASRYLPPTRAGVRPPTYDVAGAACATCGIGALVYALVEAPVVGWVSPPAMGGFFAAAVFLTAFSQIERHTRAPLLTLGLVLPRHRARSLLVAFIASAALFTQAYLTTLTLQRLLGFSPLIAGAAFLSLNASVITGSRLASRVIAAIGIRAALIMGLLLGAAGLALRTQLGLVSHPYFPVIVPGMIVAGLGQGIMFTSIFIVGASGVAPAQQGVASGLITNATWVGSSLGLALLVAAQHEGTTILDGLSFAYFAAAILAVISALLALALPRPSQVALVAVVGVDVARELPPG